MIPVSTQQFYRKLITHIWEYCSSLLPFIELNKLHPLSRFAPTPLSLTANTIHLNRHSSVLSLASRCISRRGLMQSGFNKSTRVGGDGIFSLTRIKLYAIERTKLTASAACFSWCPAQLPDPTGGYYSKSTHISYISLHGLQRRFGNVVIFNYNTKPQWPQ